MKKSGILALDIGTSSIRASIYIKNEGIKYSLSLKHHLTDRFCINNLWNNTCELMKKLTNLSDNLFVEAVGISSFLGWVVVKENGDPVEKAWSWMAYGNQEELRKAKEKFGTDINNVIGRELNEQLGVFYWGDSLRSNKDVMVLSVKDFINFKLTNKFMMDRTHASYTGLYSIMDNSWDCNLLKFYNLTPLNFPELGYGNEVLGDVCSDMGSDLGLSPLTKVIVGGPDGTLAVLGGGGFKAGRSVEVMGTTDVFFHVAQTVDTQKVTMNGLVQNSFILPGLFCIGGPTGMTGGTLEYLMKKWNWNFNHPNYLEMIEQWNDIKAVESGLYIIPELTGSRVPDWNPNTRGTMVGLNPSHGSREIFKSTLESIAFNTKRIKDKIESLVSPIDEVIVIGGGAKNKKFVQTRASIAGCSMCIPEEVEASTLGIIILASVAIKWYQSTEESGNDLNSVKHIVSPEMNEIKKYDHCYEKYTTLADIMGEWYHE